MKNFKRLSITVTNLIIIISILISYTPNSISTNLRVTSRQLVKVAVISFKLDDPYLSLVRQDLEKIQSENNKKVEFSFFDSKGNQSVQDEIIDNLLRQQIDLFVINLVDTSITTVSEIVNKIKMKNVPIILFNLTQDQVAPVKAYNKAFVISMYADKLGTLQGKILVNEWNLNKETMDKNKDNIMQYVMLTGNSNNTVTIARTKYSVLSINNEGIKTQELALRVCNFDRELAKSAIDSLFLKYGNSIEAIIANNDAMAIGAIEGLQKYGYNKGNKKMNIPVVGIDAIPEAQDLIKKGFMTGTVAQDHVAQAEAIYKIGMNLINNIPPTEGTDYKVDETGVTIYVPYKEYVGK